MTIIWVVASVKGLGEALDLAPPRQNFPLFLTCPRHRVKILRNKLNFFCNICDFQKIFAIFSVLNDKRYKNLPRPCVGLPSTQIATFSRGIFAKHGNCGHNNDYAVSFFVYMSF